MDMLCFTNKFDKNNELNWNYQSLGVSENIEADI